MEITQLNLNSELNLSSNPEKLDLTNMTKYERLGFIGESFFHAELKSVAKEFGLRIKWTGKRSYDKRLRNEFRRGVDFKLYDEKGQLFWANENKNLKNPKRQYSLETAQNVVVNRFNDVHHAKHRSVSLPNFNVFNYQAREFIVNQGIEVFEFGKLIGAKDFRNKNFHVIRSKLRQFIKGLFNKDKEHEKFKQEESKKLTEWFNSQQTNNQPNNKYNSLANFILSCLSNYVLSYDYSTNTSYETIKQTIDRPIENNVENTKLTVDSDKEAKFILSRTREEWAKFRLSLL